MKAWMQREQWFICPPPVATAAIRSRPADAARSNCSPPDCKFGAEL
jgi:hypothetical protein